jgi:4-diphosphocytidyl-2-C-methyl-D-erythritol kinase
VVEQPTPSDGQGSRNGSEPRISASRTWPGWPTPSQTERWMAEPLRALPVSEPAPAKLNVFLRVRGRRDDGYHQIETLVQPITLADGVRASHRDEGFGLTVAGDLAPDVPSGSENLVLRAARALAEETRESRGANLTLVKSIPVAAGLGGGSADAAATLRALDRLWGYGLPSELLSRVAADVGSDVPALVSGGPVLVGGRGERLENVTVARTWWVLTILGFGISAGDAYGWWDQDGEETGPDPVPLLEAVTVADPPALGPLLFNDLEGPVTTRHPEVGRAREGLLAAGAVGAVMCGSGPTVAGLARDGRHAEDLAAAVGGIAVGSLIRTP